MKLEHLEPLKHHIYVLCWFIRCKDSLALTVLTLSLSQFNTYIKYTIREYSIIYYIILLYFCKTLVSIKCVRLHFIWAFSRQNLCGSLVESKTT